MDPASIDARREAVAAQLTARNQTHVLRWWDELTSAQRLQLLADLGSIPWDTVDPLIDSHVRNAPTRRLPSGLTPPAVYPHETDPGERREYAEAIEQGRNQLRDGKVAAFTVAGGQGTRLGFDGPKGAVAVTPVGDRTLFELFAGMVKAARGRSEAAIPWYIMTSPGNHDDTEAFLTGHSFFGLPEADVRLFSQGMLPAFDAQGRLLLVEKHRVALAPDGHGGSLKALCTSGALADMQRRGITTISYFQVDNPLVKPFDPLFIGLHTSAGSDMSTKVAAKADDLEAVGNLCMQDGKLGVVEYSEFPEQFARARNDDGSRKFDAGNLAIHLLDVAFVERIVGVSFELPFRRAEKKVTHIDEQGASVEPETPNAIKLETFVFDALPLANNPLVLEVDRSEEFSPVKNATGTDSLDTSKRDQMLRACRWLDSAEVPVPRKPDGSPDVTITIAPSFALDADEVRLKRDQIGPIRAGDAVSID